LFDLQGDFANYDCTGIGHQGFVYFLWGFLRFGDGFSLLFVFKGAQEAARFTYF